MAVLVVLILAVGFRNETQLLYKPAENTTDNSFAKGKEKLIIIEDFSAGGSKLKNEFGNTEDWIQLYNTTGNTLQLEPGRWFLTDDVIGNPRKFELPELTIAPYESLIIWCDKMNTVEDYIHTNFKLAAEGEKIGLLYFSNMEYTVVDVLSYECTKK